SDRRGAPRRRSTTPRGLRPRRDHRPGRAGAGARNRHRGSTAERHPHDRRGDRGAGHHLPVGESSPRGHRHDPGRLSRVPRRPCQALLRWGERNLGPARWPDIRGLPGSDPAPPGHEQAHEAAAPLRLGVGIRRDRAARGAQSQHQRDPEDTRGLSPAAGMDPVLLPRLSARALPAAPAQGLHAPGADRGRQRAGERLPGAAEPAPAGRLGAGIQRKGPGGERHLGDALRQRGLGAVLAVGVSLSRTDVLGAVVTLAAFAALSFSVGRRVARPLAAVVVILALALPLATVVTSTEGTAVFSRYSSIAGTQAASSSTGYKSVSLKQIPIDIANAPFGFGLGTAGAASSFGGRTTVTLEGHGFSSETEYNFIMNEVGLPGLALWVAFTVYLGSLVVRRLSKVEDLDVRLFLAAIFSVLAGLTVMGFAGAFSAGSAGGPYFWFAAGVAAYWLAGPGRAVGAQRSAAVRSGAVV